MEKQQQQLEAIVIAKCTDEAILYLLCYGRVRDMVYQSVQCAVPGQGRVPVVLLLLLPRPFTLTPAQ